MKLAVAKERREPEARVAASAESVRKLCGLDLKVAVEAGAGVRAGITDEAYEAAGATIAEDYAAAVDGADVVFKVQRPLIKDEGGELDELAPLKRGAVLIGLLDPWGSRAAVEAYAAAGLSAFAMELMPRITRAQSMDALSSQANLAGYRAVVDAAAHFGRVFPMMMTAAGTVPPARVMIMGAGVAGLQAIATARRLGAVVSATDVRPAAKEEVESLGASFVAVEDEEFKQAEAAGGYAKEMSEAYKKKQADLIAETIAKQDIVITTAQVPGRPAPRLISAGMVRSMRAGSVIVDLAVEQGGNCELTRPGEVVEEGGVTVVGHRNWPSRLAASTSQLYARNLLNFVQVLIDKERGGLAFDFDDDLVKGPCLTHEGKVVHPSLQETGGGSAAAKDEGEDEAAAGDDAGTGEAGTDEAEGGGGATGKKED